MIIRVDKCSTFGIKKTPNQIHSVSETGPIDDISTLRIPILKYFMIDDSKRLDQNDLYNRNLRARERERDDTSRETCSESTCSDLYYTFLKPFCDLW